MQKEAETAEKKQEEETIGRHSGKRKQERKARLFERKDSVSVIPSILIKRKKFNVKSGQVT